MTQAPARVPAVFAGGRLLVYGFVKDALPAAVRLSATTPAGPFDVAIPLDTARSASGGTVATLAARARIRELEEGGEWLTGRGSRQTDRKQTSVSREIVDLSVRYGLVSRETSFVAIERRDAPVQDAIQLRRVPIALTSGWGGIEGRMRLRSVSGALGMPRLGSTLADAGEWTDAIMARTFRSEHDSDSSRSYPSLASLRGAMPSPSMRRRRDRASEPPPGMDALVTLQAADGSWDLTGPLAAIIGRDLTQIEAALADASGTASDVRRAWATALALAWLHLHAGGVRDDWRLLGAKAQTWIEAAGAVPPAGLTWLDAARRFLST